MPEVVSLGEMMVMFVARESGPLRSATTFEKHVAGTEANLSIALVRLGHSAGWISRLGDDDFGHYVFNFLRGEGVDVSRVKLDPDAPTGVAFKERRELGPRKVIYYRRGSAASRLSPDDLDQEYIAAAKYLHLTGITPALSASCHETLLTAISVARRHGVVVSFDPNIRLRLWDAATARQTLREIIRSCDVVLPGLDEAELLTGEADPRRAAEQILALGPHTVVVKLGPAGALGVSASEVVEVPGVKLERVVDPVGAGDGFAAGFLAGQLRGWSTADSLRLGCTVGAFATTVLGDVEGFPTQREIAEFEDGRDVQR